jgi:hypothetical protein
MWLRDGFALSAGGPTSLTSRLCESGLTVQRPGEEETQNSRASVRQIVDREAGSEPSEVSVGRASSPRGGQWLVAVVGPVWAAWPGLACRRDGGHLSRVDGDAVLGPPLRAGTGAGRFAEKSWTGGSPG